MPTRHTVVSDQQEERVLAVKRLIKKELSKKELIKKALTRKELTKGAHPACACYFAVDKQSFLSLY